MKKLVMTLCTALCTCNLMAQSTVEDDVYAASSSAKETMQTADTARASVKDKGVYFMQIPKNFRINDNVFVINRSPYLIVQMLMAVDMIGNGDYVPVGQASYVPTGQRVKIASYDDNKLKRLRGKNVLVKVKGAKINPMTNGAQVDVYTPYGSVNVDNRRVDAETIKNIKDSDITYEFRARLFEQDHDLYIQIEGKNMLDF